MGIVRRSGIHRYNIRVGIILRYRCITFQNNRAKYVCVFIHFTSSIIENIFYTAKNVLHSYLVSFEPAPENQELESSSSLLFQIRNHAPAQAPIPSR